MAGAGAPLTEAVRESASRARYEVYRDELVILRTRRGIRVDKIAESATTLMHHPAVDKELASRGSNDADRPTSTKKVIECFARAEDWAPEARLVLVKTLNFACGPGTLTDRRGELINALGLGTKGYFAFEEDVYDSFAQRIANSLTSPCNDPILGMYEDLAELALDQAITFAGVGNKELGLIRVRRLLERQLPAALATFSSRADSTEAQPYPWHAVLTRVLGVIALTGYDDEIVALRRSESVPASFAVLPAALLPQLVGIYAESPVSGEKLLHLAREAERLSAKLHRPEGRQLQPYVSGVDVRGYFHEAVDNTAGIAARLVQRAEVANTWRQIIKRARGVQEQRYRDRMLARPASRPFDDWFQTPAGVASWMEANPTDPDPWIDDPN